MLICVSTGVNSIDLIQPDSMVVQPGQSLTITCQVSGYSLTDSSYATGWIRQCEGKPMDWILHRWDGEDFYQNNVLKNKFLYHTHFYLLGDSNRKESAACGHSCLLLCTSAHSDTNHQQTCTNTQRPRESNVNTER